MIWKAAKQGYLRLYESMSYPICHYSNLMLIRLVVQILKTFMLLISTYMSSNPHLII
jgi:hypothetical protein